MEARNKMSISSEHNDVTSISPEGLEEVQNPELSDEELKSDSGIIAKIGRAPINEGVQWTRTEEEVLSEKETAERLVVSRLKTFFENLPAGKINMANVNNIRGILDLANKTDEELLHRLKDPETETWTDERVWSINYSYYRAILAELMKRENSKMPR